MPDDLGAGDEAGGCGDFAEEELDLAGGREGDSGVVVAGVADEDVKVFLLGEVVLENGQGSAAGAEEGQDGEVVLGGGEDDFTGRVG